MELDGQLPRFTRQQIESYRGPKLSVSSSEPNSIVRESEAADRCGRVSDVLTVFLTGAECPFRCTMCDLWQHTLDGPTPPGSLVHQLLSAIRISKPTDWIKLYNASNFFDPRAVPDEELPQLAEIVKDYERVIVENHPRLRRNSVFEFADRINGRLEIAMGLETIHPEGLALLNKEMTPTDFAAAVDDFARAGIDSRAFVLFQSPGIRPEVAEDWALRTIQFAQDCGVRHCSLIPTRAGNGVMEHLQTLGVFVPPTANALEQVFENALKQTRSVVVTVDVWGWDELAGHCDRCRLARKTRLEQMNQHQTVFPKMATVCECEIGQHQG